MAFVNKELMSSLEIGFKVLRENPNSEAGREILKESAEKIFPYKFNIRITHTNPEDPIFVMSVFPDTSTIDKIVSSIVKNEPGIISKLWKQSKEWTIEIDDRILKSHVVNATVRELTAIFCHEIGHIIYSNSIPTRIVNVLQYEMAKSSMTNRMLIRDKFFQKILSLPILNACMMEKNDSIKEEIKADKFVKSCGYQNDLISVMQKFQKLPKYKEEDNADTSMKKMAGFTQNAMEQFKKRETSMLESTLLRMEEECGSSILKEAVSDVYNFFFMKGEDDGSIRLEKKKDFFFEYVNDLEKEFVAMEFFGIGKKSLKRIDPNELDYITIKTKDMKTTSDKLLLVSYANNKLDTVRYYISLLDNPTEGKKYQIPYTKQELIVLESRLQKMIEEIINTKLPDRLKNVLVAWPEGYEG